MKRAHHIHHLAIRYPVLLHERVYVTLFGPFLILALMYAVFALYPFLTPSSAGVMPLSTLISAALLTLVRLAIAYFFAVVVAIPLALLVVSNSTIEALLLPVFDILESVPILAIFPIVVLFFIQIDFLEGAAFFILFLNMLWNIVFALVGGLKVIPKDITYAARIFGVRGLSYVERVLLPAAFPQFVTGSILAVAEGWNLIIVAEALHTYVPAGTSAQDLFGIGSILVSAAAHAEQGLFLTAVLVMVTLIALINFFVWQKLLHYAQRFRFD